MDGTITNIIIIIAVIAILITVIRILILYNKKLKEDKYVKKNATRRKVSRSS